MIDIKFLKNRWILTSFLFSGVVIAFAAFYRIYSKRELARDREVLDRAAAAQERANVVQDKTNLTKIYLACLKQGGKECKNPYEENEKGEKLP